MKNAKNYLAEYENWENVNAEELWRLWKSVLKCISLVAYSAHADEYGNSTQDSKEYFYPEQKDGSDFSMNVRRHNYMMRFIAIDPNRVNQFFVPWVCKQNPGATKVQFGLILTRIPSLDKVITLKGTPYDDLLVTEELNPNVFNCPSKS